MSTARRFRVGYMLADPGVDLSKREGGPVHVERIVGGLRAAGHEVTFVAVQEGQMVLTDTGYGLQQFFEATRFDNGAKRTAVPRASTLLSKEVFRLFQDHCFPFDELVASDQAFCAGRRAFRGCELIHARLSPFDVGGVLCARDLRKPFVVEVNTPPLVEAEHFYPDVFRDRSERLARLAATETLEGASAIVTVSSPLRDFLVSNWKVDARKVTVLPNAADTPPPTPPDRMTELRAEHQLGFGPIVAFVGALQLWHGLEALLEAFAKVRLEHPDARLLLVGDGPRRKLLEQRVGALDLQSSVRFTGAVDHERVAELLTIADVAVAPYPHLPFDFYFSPIKMFEYMAAGKAIVASQVGGQVAEILTDGETALLVEPGNNEELAQAIGRLLGDTELRRRLGERARRKAEREHTWGDYANRLAAIYERVLTPVK